ncbi:hypothetical protein GGS20DRAFT_247818 [Poronia punctata]|nr:hypothetical protein GGS20DRAFT_247818 [Poronia punctata]
MPVVNLPLQGAHSIISSGHIPPGKAQPIVALGVAFLGALVLLTLVLALGRNYKTSPSLVPLEKRAVPMEKERHFLSERSRERNHSEPVIMPVRRHSKSSRSRPQGAHNEGDFDNMGGSSQHQSPGGGISGHQTKSDATRRDMGRPQPFFEAHYPPPEPLPLTPPGQPALFSFQDRRLSMAASSNGDFERGLVYRSNSDSNTSYSTTSMAPTSQAPSPTSLRDSYAKLLPLDISHGGSAMGAKEMGDDHSSAFSFGPSSFPLSNPTLPLAPHHSLEPRQMTVVDDTIPLELDDTDAIWKRHTRVHGGGVCLACLAAGDDEGGYYGDNVPLEQRRY